LLIDEIDRGSNKLMCMQSILEGKPLFNKKTGEMIYPTQGFTVVATANTKGRGTDDGRFIAAQILDEAFLERFPITVEQEYPSTTVEKKILHNKMKFFGKEDEEFADKLINWADIIRKTFMEGGVDEIISTRRLVNIAQAYSIFNNQNDAIRYCINRFDEDTKTSFMALYEKLSRPLPEADAEYIDSAIEQKTTNPPNDIPF
jgi:MoxR-like ATPase